MGCNGLQGLNQVGEKSLWGMVCRLEREPGHRELGRLRPGSNQGRLSELGRDDNQCQRAAHLITDALQQPDVLDLLWAGGRNGRFGAQEEREHELIIQR